MINFNYETDFKLEHPNKISTWILNTIVSEGFIIGDINYIFCSDDYLHKINVDFLNHDTYTDIISFDYSVGNTISGDIYISIDRVIDNANAYKVSFNDELSRVIIHGILHYCGYKDKSNKDKLTMTSKEDFYINELSFIV